MRLLIVLTAFAAISLATPLPTSTYDQAEAQSQKGAPSAPSQAAAASASPASNSTASGTSGAVNSNLVPQFGVTAGQGKSKGTCAGINGVRIPCNCPPSRDQFISKLNQFVAVGNAFGTKTPFPEDDSEKSQSTRLETSIVTLQNLNGPGKGCPAASTTFVAQRKAVAG